MQPNVLPGILICGLLPGVLGADDHLHDLGAVRFPVSCTPAAQKTFERGVALLHSFWYDEAEKTFSEAARADPACAMADWGVAMSRYHPLWAPPTPADLKKGREAVEKAKAAGARTQRERDYIAAIEVFYRDSQKTPHRERALAWCKAMHHLSVRYPEDREAAIFYALSLIGTAPAHRQDLCQPETGGGDPESHSAGAAGPSGHRPLHDSQLRLATARDSRPAGGAQLRQDRSRGAARTAHALAHFHAAGPVAGLDRLESCFRCSGQEPRGEDSSGRGGAGSAACDGLPGLRIPADLPGR